MFSGPEWIENTASAAIVLDADLRLFPGVQPDDLLASWVVRAREFNASPEGQRAVVMQLEDHQVVTRKHGEVDPASLVAVDDGAYRHRTPFVVFTRERRVLIVLATCWSVATACVIARGLHPLRPGEN